MNRTRRLVLRREALNELTPSELNRVAGATHIATDCGCITHGISCDQCPPVSIPIRTCPSIVFVECVSFTTC